jgi:transcriptional regulator GlxA family with amidase domain
LARRFPKLKVDPDALFINDGKPSAGITDGIDLSLALIEEDYGAGVSLSVARELVVTTGGQVGRSSSPSP